MNTALRQEHAMAAIRGNLRDAEIAKSHWEDLARFAALDRGEMVAFPIRG